MTSAVEGRLLSRSQRVELGLAARRRAPRSGQANWEPAAGRDDPVSILEAQSRDRVPELVPIRYGRMLVSPFAFFRGSAAVMAHDLATRSHSNLMVQLCGDAHLSNFGLYASPERHLLFGLNDFDETLPGPFEWDVKRLAASVAVVARDRGFSRKEQRDAALAVGLSYQARMAEFAAMRELDLWYYRIEAADAMRVARREPVRMSVVRHVVTRAHVRDHLRALGRLTTLVEGRRVITHTPPLVVHAAAAEIGHVQEAFADYLATIPLERRLLLERYQLVDVARKVVGVGSVGTRCWVALFEGRDEHDPLFLQIKEATGSVLEPHLGPSDRENHGERVVVGQRLTQAASDIFLGWTQGRDGRHYYWRQLWDMKGSLDPAVLSPAGLRTYASVCAWALARAHAKTGDRIAIAAYLGGSNRFAEAIAEFAGTYANQATRDHALLAEAERSGRIEAMHGL